MKNSRNRECSEFSAIQALANLRVWHLACIGFTQAIGFYSMSFWMPQEVKSLSLLYTNTTVGILVPELSQRRQSYWGIARRG